MVHYLFVVETIGNITEVEHLADFTVEEYFLFDDLNNKFPRFMLVCFLAKLVIIIRTIILQSILNFLSKRHTFETAFLYVRIYFIWYHFIDHSITQILDLPTQKHRLIICTLLNDVNLLVNYLIIQFLQFYLTELFIQSLS